MELAKFALSNKGDVAVYVEHTMSTIECIEQLDNGTVSGKKQENGEDGKNMDVGVFNEIGKWEDANDDVGIELGELALEHEEIGVCEDHNQDAVLAMGIGIPMSSKTPRSMWHSPYVRAS
ncbi:hypothetical protein JHK87_040858 [Glycine soja]|nr:hypothetical protein JHK87_040858 [Glycine soja]